MGIAPSRACVRITGKGKNMKFSTIPILSAATILSAMWAPAAAWADTAVDGTQDNAPATEKSSTRQNSGVLNGDIIVTAQKRSQNLQDVGIAVTALSGEQLTTLGLTTSVDIARMASNVSISGSYGGQMSQFTIRGVTQNDFNDHVESVVAVYVDDAYVAMQQGQSFGMFDLDRVEVLKGPQGTLFGRNATGGLVHFITRRPTKDFQGYIDATYGSYNNVRIEGGAGGPLAEGLRARLSGMYERWDGYLDNRYPQETFVPAAFQPNLHGTTLPGAGSDLGGLKYNFAVRGQVEADITNNTLLWVSAYYNKSVASTAPYQNLPTVAVLNAAGKHINTLDASSTQVCQVIQSGQCIHGIYSSYPGSTRPVPGADFFGYLDPDGSGPITSSDYAFDNLNVFKTYGVTGRLTVNLGNTTLTAISDYKHFDKNFSLDVDASPANQFVWHGDANVKSFSQELRLNGKAGPLTWVAGGYFLAINNHSVHGIGALPDSAYPFPDWDQPRIANLKSRSYSAFGQVEYAATDKLTLIGGLRVSREKKDYDFHVLFVYPNTNGNPFDWNYSPAVDFPGFSQDLYTAKSAETLWSWKAQINYKPSPDVLLYAGVTQGAKAGSFNAGAPPLAPSDIPYKAEKLISYETGIKAKLFDRRLRFNASAFYYDYQNYQAARWLDFSSLIVNANAYIYGGEAEMVASFTHNLEGSLNVGFQKNKVKDVPFGGGVKDVHMTFAPEWTLSALLRYTVPTPVASGSLAFQVDGNYQSKVWHNLNNFDANTLAAWGIVNARIDWTSGDEKLKFSVFARNLLNKHYDTVGFDLSQICGCNLSAQGKPRWIGAEARYSF